MVGMLKNVDDVIVGKLVKEITGDIVGRYVAVRIGILDGALDGYEISVASTTINIIIIITTRIIIIIISIKVISSRSLSLKNIKQISVDSLLLNGRDDRYLIQKILRPGALVIRTYHTVSYNRDW